MEIKEGKKQKDTKTYSYLLIALCWIVYACSYIGKLGYNANIIQIEKVFGVSHSESGSVSSFFFFAYGAGQIINGLFCKKYNLKYVVFVGLILSGLSNILIGIVKDFYVVKYVWIINGGALSVLWTSLVRFLSETLDKKYMSKAVVVMGTTVATGTFLVYGLSTIFVALNVFKLIFFIAGTLLPLIAVLWFVFSPTFAKKIKNLTQNEDENVKSENNEDIKPQGKTNSAKGLAKIFIVFGVFAIMTNLIKDGLITWVPIVLNESFNLPDYASILLTLALPICAIFGAYLVVGINKKIKDFSIINTLLFAGSCCLIGVVIGMLNLNVFVVTVISFALIACLMSGVNNVVTSMMPLYWKDKINSGRIAGIMNGCCYLGSTISSYGLGLVADLKGWNFVFWILFWLCAVTVLVGLIEFVLRRFKNKRIAG